MNELNQAKEEYENIPIPEELAERIQAGIRQGRSNYRRRLIRRTAGSVAACVAVLVGILNLSPTVAAAAADVPVLGGLFQVLTVRDYDTVEDQAHYTVTVPEVQADSSLAKKVNQEIQTIVDSHIADMKAAWKTYHQAFLAAGGTEEEWAKRDMQISVDYEIKSQTDTAVSFMVDLSQCGVNASQTQYYYNLNLAEDRDITLEDLLGEDWVSICNASIQAQIDASADAGGFSYFFTPEDEGFTTVDETTSFYIREDGVPVVVFPEYSIAAGAAGVVEFPVN